MNIIVKFAKSKPQLQTYRLPSAAKYAKYAMTIFVLLYGEYKI